MTTQFKIYGMPVCPRCDMAKNLLKSKGMTFEYIDLIADAEALSMVKSKGVTEAPFVQLDSGEDVGGFKQLQEYLNAKS